MDALTEAISRITRLETELNRLKSQRPHWEDWTPTFTQSVSVAATVDFARYTIVNNVVHVACKVTFTGSGSTGMAIASSGLPYGNANANNEFQRVIGFFQYKDTGTVNYLGLVFSVTATSVAFEDSITKLYLGSNPSFAIANTDEMGFSLSYEKA